MMVEKQGFTIYESANIKLNNKTIISENLQKTISLLTSIAEKLREAFKGLAESFRNLYKKNVRPVIVKMIEIDNKPNTYKSNLHSFLGTDKHQRRMSFNIIKN